MSNPISENAIDALRRLHRDMDEALRDLPGGAVGWSPGEGMNSLAVLAAHTAGAQRYWIGTMVGGRPTDRVRAEEFEAKAATAAQLRALLSEALAESEAVLRDLELDHLERMVVSPTHQRPFQVAWSLLHAIDHTALHTGHIQMTRQLWDRQAD